MEDQAISALMDRYPATRDVVTACRRFLTSSFPGSSETADLSANVISYSYGAGYKPLVATLILGRESVKIGIPYGAAFEDPAGLLEGKGKVHKHVVVDSLQDLERPALAALLAASRDACTSRISIGSS